MTLDADPRPDDFPDVSSWDMDQWRWMLDQLSDHIGDWQGIPIPLGDDMPLRLAAGHPLAAVYGSTRNALPDSDVEVRIVPDPNFAEHEALFTCHADTVRDDERVVNSWFSRKLQAEVIVFHRGGRAFSVKVPRSPDRSMDRLDLWLKTIGASDAWDVDAEHAAREHLRGMLTERQWRHYDLTGCFLETSERSRLLYVFRRLRPTLALSFRGRDGRETVRCLAALCLHPIGYYDRTWGGCMVPTDDVIAHLTWMRGDEARYWGVANQHELAAPEAGL